MFKGKKFIFILCAVALLTAAVASTVAYIISVSSPAVNEFTPAKVSCTVNETFANGVKSNVSVKNTGNTNAFIRAAVVANWVDDSGKVYSEMPKEGTDFSLLRSSSKWTEGSDGFYYYASVVAPEGSTENLIDSAAPITTPPEGYSLSIKILASAVQSAPSSAAEEAWKVTVRNGTLYPNR